MDQKKIGFFLRELRRGKELTQQQLADEFGVTVRTVSRWETGSNLPDIDLLMLLADYYEVDLQELLRGSRKDETMDDEMKKTVQMVSDYKDIAKKKLSVRMCVMFVVGLFMCTLYLIMEFAEVANTPFIGFIRGFALGVTWGMLLIGILYTSGVLFSISAMKSRTLGRDR